MLLKLQKKLKPRQLKLTPKRVKKINKKVVEVARRREKRLLLL